MDPAQVERELEKLRERVHDLANAAVRAQYLEIELKSLRAKMWQIWVGVFLAAMAAGFSVFVAVLATFIKK